MTQPDANTVTRYFYTDPLAAAWMAKHFGMKFGIEHQGVIAWDCIGRIDGPWGPLTEQEHILDTISQHSVLHVHPDSLHLLEPKAGDVFRGVDASCDNVEYRIFQVGHDTGIRLEAWFRIIQRDDKPFMWPDQEAV